ncbi:rarD protein [Geosporobacter subterraneus DSM 17957]|uniref:RarD protein n=1 Tax=Geosporobacter subterraneus DSM 17957 TaxID=1121919 RepID=A0A1M6EH17_9FIRM|nr:EamA family transporter [Geosporobacter subterraneus]SHI84679.1 rarD protein [Geosporobacter subterraneus DSM 17957]
MRGKIKIITAMLVFGSIGVFVKNINLSSSEIALLRGIIGSLFLICASFFSKQKLSMTSIKENIIMLVLSGAAIGFNWIFLFQAYKYTTISNATLSYYFAPIFVTMLSPFILKEKLSPGKIGCILTAMIGLFLIVSMGEKSVLGTYNHPVGIAYGLSAAVLYASIVLMNKFIKNLSGFETTVIQLIIAALVLAPYVFMKENMDLGNMNATAIICILILGIIHTGIAYFLYFTSIQELKGQTIAALSYIDPISAVIIAAIFLGENMGFIQVIGGILILGSTFLSDRIDAKPYSVSNIEA